MPEQTDDRPVPAVSSSLNTAHFDAAAATWDENPQRRALTTAIATAIQQAIPLDRHWRVLEYGCGTAVLSFLLAPHVREVVAADASPGMIEQACRKLAACPVAGLSVRVLDLTQEAAPPESFDLIMMGMALHHIADVPSLLKRLDSMLAKNGWLVIADLCSEDGSFHDPMKVPHDGFAPEALVETLTGAAGSVQCASQVIHQFEKNGRSYPIFLLTARKG